MQVFVVGHDTPTKLIEIAPEGTAGCCVARLVPFQRSMTPWLAGVEPSYHPTAVHALRDAHDTPVSAASEAPAGVPLTGNTDHVAALADVAPASAAAMTHAVRASRLIRRNATPIAEPRV